jgi:hypothetical protein
VDVGLLRKKKKTEDSALFFFCTIFHYLESIKSSLNKAKKILKLFSETELAQVQETKKKFWIEKVCWKIFSLKVVQKFSFFKFQKFFLTKIIQKEKNIHL